MALNITMRELMSLGVTVYFEKENINTETLTTELMVSVSGALAQQESISTSQNQRISYKRRMERGEFITCKAPYGYRIKDGKNLEANSGVPQDNTAVYDVELQISDNGGAKGTQVRDFQVGDIYIDPSRCVVRAKERSVRLRPREFALLLYFMEHSGHVLTANQICRGAWRMDYTQSVGRSVHELRKQIEANPSQPCYIKTVYRMGYRFTGYSSEICDN